MTAGQKSIDMVIRYVGDSASLAAETAEMLDLDLARALARLYLIERALDAKRRATLAAERAAERAALERLSQAQLERHPYVPPAPTPEPVEQAEPEPWPATSADRWLARMVESARELTEALRMEWTAELLASDFAMPDGTRVTWGAATLAQHEQRRAMFAANVLANAEGAARHDQAIQTLRLGGAACLAELVAAPV